jgi:hypothetical protein
MQLPSPMQNQDDWTMIERHEAEGSAGSPVPPPPDAMPEEDQADRILKAVTARTQFDKDQQREGRGKEDENSFNQGLTVPKMFLDLMLSSLHDGKRMEEDDIDDEDRIAQALAFFFLELGSLSMPALSWIERRTREPLVVDLEGPRFVLTSLGTSLRQASVKALGRAQKIPTMMQMEIQRLAVDEEGKPTWLLVYFLGGATISASALLAIWSIGAGRCPRWSD